MRLRHVAFAVTALASSALLAQRARGDEQSDLDKGKAAYFAKNYQDADQRFGAMLDEKSGTLHDPLLVAEARMYWAAALFAEGRADDAKALLEKLILENPAYEPDASRLPQDIVNVFIDEKASLRETLRKQREQELADKRAREQAEKEEKAHRERYLAALEAQASEVPVDTRHSRLVGLLPYGVGQFQNGDRALGFTFAISETLFSLAAVAAVPGYLIEVADAASEYSTYGEAHRTQFEDLRSRANAWRDVNLASIGAFALTYAVGVIQAEAAFVPKKTEIEHRALPKVSLAPALGEAPRGAWVGVNGSF